MSALIEALPGLDARFDARCRMELPARSNNALLEVFASTGIPGVDQVLAGGFTPHRLYLLERVPGSGKTPLAMQFRGVLTGVPVHDKDDDNLRAGSRP